MKNKIAIIANGTIKDYDFHKKMLKDSDIIICADGGANKAEELQIIPDYIIGDLDIGYQYSIYDIVFIFLTAGISYFILAGFRI